MRMSGIPRVPDEARNRFKLRYDKCYKVDMDSLSPLLYLSMHVHTAFICSKGLICRRDRTGICSQHKLSERKRRHPPK